MAELRLSISTQQAQQAAQAFQRILNDIKIAAREVDSLSLNNMGGAIGRTGSELEKLQGTLRSVAAALTAALNVDPSKLSAIPGQLNTVATAAKETAKSVMTVAEALEKGFKLTPNQLVGELKRQAAEAITIQQSLLQTQLNAEKSYAQQLIQVRQSLASALSELGQKRVQAKAEAEGDFQWSFRQQITDLKSAQTAYQAFASQVTQTQPRQIAQYSDSTIDSMYRQQQPPTIAMPQFTETTEVARRVLEAIRQEVLHTADAFDVLGHATSFAQRQIAQFSDATMNAMYRQQLGPTIAMPQYTESTLAARGIQQSVQGGQDFGFPSRYGRSVDKTSTLERASITLPGNEQQGIAPHTFFPGQGSVGTNKPGQLFGAAYDARFQAALDKELPTALGKTGEALAQTKVKKDALDKNMGEMSRQGGSLWQMSFGLRILAGALGYLSFRSLIEEAKSLTETLVDTGMQLERATALFGLMKEGTMTSSQGVALATATAQEFGLAVLPAIEGLGRMQASAYGTAAAGETVSNAFRGMMAALGAIGADSKSVTQTMNALSDSIGRSEISGRNLRQLSREFPGLKERAAEAFGSKSVEEFMVVLDKGNITMKQWLDSLTKAFSGSITDMARENINKLTGATTAFHNALLGLIQVILNAGFKTDFITGLNDLTAVLTSPSMLDGARQFSHMFGTVVRDALELVATVVLYLTRNIELLAGAFTALAAGGIIVGIISGLGLLAIAVSALGASFGPVLLGVTAIATVLGEGALIYTAYKHEVDLATQGAEAFRKKQLDLAQLPRPGDTAFIGPVFVQPEHQVRFAADEEKVREQIERLKAQTVGYRTELGLLDEGLRKDSVEFAGLSVAYKFINQEIARGNTLLKEGTAFSKEKREELIRLAQADASVAAQIAKREENAQLVRGQQRRVDALAPVLQLAREGAGQATTTIEQEFQQAFVVLKDRYENLFHLAAEGDIPSLTEDFKKQALALRQVSIEVALLTTEFKHLTEAENIDQQLQLSKAFLALEQSSLGVRRATSVATVDDAQRVLASQEPPTFTAGSTSVNAFLRDVERTSIDRTRQIINGPVAITVNGTVTMATPAQVATATGGPGTPSQYQSMLLESVTKHGVDQTLATVIMTLEGGRNVEGVPTKYGRAQGPMQVMPDTLRGYGVAESEFKDPAKTIDAGVRYLADIVKAFPDNFKHQVAAYFVGIPAEQAAIKAGKDYPNSASPNDTTANYVWKAQVEKEKLAMTPLKPAPAVTSLELAGGATALPFVGAFVAGVKEILPTLRLGMLGTAARSIGTGSGALLGTLIPTTLDVPRGNADMPGESTKSTTTPLYTQDQIREMDRATTLWDTVERSRGQGVIAQMRYNKEIEEQGKIEERNKVIQEEVGRRKEVGVALDKREQSLTANIVTADTIQRSSAIQVDARSRTRIEVEREMAAEQALQKFNQSVGVTEQDRAERTDRYLRDEEMRLKAVTQAYELFDTESSRSTVKYIQRLEDDAAALTLETNALREDARYRQISIQLLQEEDRIRQTTEKGPLQEKALEAARALAAQRKALQDLKGPLQDYRDSLLGIKDLDIGLQRVTVGAVQDLAENYLNVKNVQSRLSAEGERRTQDTQGSAVRAEDARYVRALQDFQRQQRQPVTEDQSRAYSTQLQMLKVEHEQLGLVAKDTQDSFSVFAQVGFLFRSFADTVIDALQKMVVEMLIVKPLVAELQGALSGQAVQGGFAQTFGALLGGAGGASFTTTGPTGATLAGSEAIIAGAGLQTGGYVTLRGVEHFQHGGVVGHGTDTVPAMLTPGEVILNQAQQKNVAGAMQGGNTYIFAPTVHAQDAESVKKTMPQMQAEFYRSTERIAKRNNVR